MVEEPDHVREVLPSVAVGVLVLPLPVEVAQHAGAPGTRTLAAAVAFARMATYGSQFVPFGSTAVALALPFVAAWMR